MAKKEIKKSDIYGGSTYPDKEIYRKYSEQEEKKSKKQEKTPVKSGDNVKFTKPKKNEYGEWNVKVYVNGKAYKPAEIFADSKEDALGQIEDAKKIYKKNGVTITEEVKTVKNILREEILEMVGILSERKGDYEIYHNTYTSAIQEAEKYCEEQGFFWNKDESFAKIGSGPRKPQEGKTNKFSLELYTKDNKPAGKAVHLQVYGMGSRYELNVYLSPMKKKDYQYYEGDE